MPNAYSNQLAAASVQGWYVYVVTEEGNQYCKIGTALNPAYRFSGLGGGNPRILSCVALFHFRERDIAYRVEKWALQYMGEARQPKRDWCSGHYSVAIDAVIRGIIRAGVPDGTFRRTI